MAQIRDFTLPDLGEGLEEGDIVEWLVEVGDEIELNAPVASIETAKAVVEVPSPFAGTVVERIGGVGETIEVGAVLVRIEVAGGAGDGAPAAPSGSAGASATATGGGGTDDGDEKEPQPLVGYGQRGARTRRRRGGTSGDGGGAADTGGDGTAEARGDGAADAGGVARRTDSPTAPAGTTGAGDDGATGAASATAGRPLAKPPVRKLAKDLGVDLAAIMPGSGDDGVITRDDVRAAAASAIVAEQAPPPPASADVEARPGASAGAPRVGAAEVADLAASGAGEKPVPGFRGRRPGEVEQVAGIRKRIIAKMERSRRDIPHALCARDADLTALWDLRRDLTDQARREGFDVAVTPTALVMRATVLALRRFPTLNAVYDVDAAEIRLLEHINLGVAVDTDRGLIVPNVKAAHAKSLLQLAAETAVLAARCRDGSATPGELTGGTFTVDNYGYFGNDDGNPIINAPEVGILGIGAIRERPWVVEGRIEVRRVARFQLAFDHRVCDGGEAGRFVTYLADLCEQPARLLLHL